MTLLTFGYGSFFGSSTHITEQIKPHDTFRFPGHLA